MSSTAGVARRVAQKELLLFFSSPVAWLFLISFSAITFFIFFWVEAFFARNVADVRPLFEWMPVLLIFLCAALAMRSWSEERRAGTLEHLLTQPASPWLFVLGKFRACMFMLILALAATAPLPISVSLMANLDWGPVAAGYVATSLLGATYLSVGLFASSRTDNSIVALIVTVAICGALYLAGSPVFTEFFDTRTTELLRSIGTGARFESITRGVFDARDLWYYLSLTLVFLTLNVFSLERHRWAGHSATRRHRYWRLLTILIVLNLLLSNVWLSRLDNLRLDLTQGRVFSISEPTYHFLEQLEEPLLIRGYFSAKTHPLLAPLVPQLRDLAEEYAVASKGRVIVEFVDPANYPELEKEANERFGITPAPFQIADRYQTALVNSYFNILIKYGDEHQTLGFRDLIEVRTAANDTADVLLRNPEYDLTRAIKNTLQDYQMGGGLFERIAQPVELIGYVSPDEYLPQPLQAYKQSIQLQLADIVARSGGKLSMRFIEPEARDGAIAKRILDQWGFRPMTSQADQDQTFYFYLTLADQNQVVQLPMGDFNPEDFRMILDTGLKRFATGFTRTVALSIPEVSDQMARHHLGAPTFNNLETALSVDHSIRLEDLADGAVTAEADVLAVLAPQRLDDASLFAIDQFLMRGGTVVIATSPFSAQLSDGKLELQDWDSGLQDWLKSHGLSIGDSLVLDKQSSLFPAPVVRDASGHQFRDVQMLDYPYFIDLRKGGLSHQHPITSNLPQLTMAWASPITVTRQQGTRLTTLLTSSAESWLSDSMDITPVLDTGGTFVFDNAEDKFAPQKLGVILRGRFQSYFEEAPPLPNSRPQSLLTKASEAARIVLFSSNDFLDDQVLRAQVMASGTQYLGPVELFLNSVDWALQDDELLSIRSRGHFNRTLPPMDVRAQAIIEGLNYALAVIWLLIGALAFWLNKRARLRRYRVGLNL
ncbi:MAG: Gldg family protein [Pseudomonadota bacterium]